MNIVLFLIALLLLSACQPGPGKPDFDNKPASSLTPADVMAAATADDWRSLDPENMVVLTLDSGQVIIELFPEMAPGHVINTRHLIRAGVFDDTQFYRVLDGFVAQGGLLYESEDEVPELQQGSYQIEAELTRRQPLPDRYLAFDQSDGYASETGFLDSAAIGRDLNTGESWLLHCYGALGMGRTDDLNSGGVALYVVNGPAQRYLDRNTTVFGRVVDGMAHIQGLKRTADLSGSVELESANTIRKVVVAADLPDHDKLEIQVLDSASESFAELLNTRKNRTGSWFVHQHDYMDACGVPVPVRIKPE
ncbi:peptidylprolyl isomerase [Marinicella sediminis]|uniref:peptidylprolyl isomerase n=1 Tax=Marinicella sediminis TaxID=1792834 RepID=A0ABV7JC78_9GAMM|nr:peptidylprolyl isomerase [Marinicella sediminis]